MRRLPRRQVKNRSREIKYERKTKNGWETWVDGRCEDHESIELELKIEIENNFKHMETV